VHFPGQEGLSDIVAGEDGHFTSYQFDPGDVPMEIRHPDYSDGSCLGVVPGAGGDVEVRCELIALPRVGAVNGRVVGADGAAVSAEVQIAGPTGRTISTDASGAFSVADLPPGAYTALVQAENYLVKMQPFTVAARETVEVEINLAPKPRRSLVQVRRRVIQIRRQINFATDSAEILPTSFDLMEQIADVMIRNPDIALVEIQGHTDNRGRPQHNQELSQQRADSVRQWLVEHGVQGSRLEAMGYGMSQPLVPNITPANRARNRRVQFIIKERTETQ
jgi:outer membrane protein OmpA-like peptidoglycan-associated protein